MQIISHSAFLFKYVCEESAYQFNNNNFIRGNVRLYRIIINAT